MIMQIIFWRILRYSGVFRYWYEKFLNELMFDLDLLDIEQQRIKEKYYRKLNFIRKIK